MGNKVPLYNASTFSLDQLLNNAFVKKNYDNKDIYLHIEKIIESETNVQILNRYNLYKDKLKDNDHDLINCVFAQYMLGLLADKLGSICAARKFYTKACENVMDKNTKDKITERCIEKLSDLEVKKNCYKDINELKCILNDSDKYTKLENLIRNRDITKRDISRLRKDLKILIRKQLLIATTLYQTIQNQEFYDTLYDPTFARYFYS